MLSNHIAVIPARGGSTRIKNKNVVDFCGKPLVAWTIEAAIRSSIFDEIIVTTDCELVREVSRAYPRVKIVGRIKYADNYSPSSLATLDALNQIENQERVVFNYVTQLLPTCPLRDEKVIKKFIGEFEISPQISSISCVEIPFFNINWAFHKDEKGEPKYLREDYFLKRSQDIDKAYVTSGAIWTASVSELKKSRSFYSERHAMRVVNWLAGADIDNELDLKLLSEIVQKNV
jgi:CMP-N-acetylneuraminic acid synthetase